MKEYITEITSVEHFQNIFNTDVKDDKIYVLDVWASWCAPCKQFMPKFEEVADEIGPQGKVNFYKIDCGNAEFRDLAKNTLSITNIPTILFFKNGVEVLRKSNPHTAETFKEYIEEANK